MEQVKRVVQFETSDGEVFYDENDAATHQAHLNLTKYFREDLEEGAPELFGAEDIASFIVENAGAIEYQLRQYLGIKVDGSLK